jgi:hypothetical protein
VTDTQELDGWRLRLELGRWHLPLPMMPIRESVKRSRVYLVLK